MPSNIQITFQNLDPSPAMEELVREHAARLDRFFDRIAACRVVIGSPHRQHRKGRIFTVHINLTVPGGELVVGRDGRTDHAHEDLKVAIHDAFDAARRELEDHARRMRGDVKTHAVPQHGRVLRLYPADGYGFIGTSEGREVYFHRNSVVDGHFDELSVGMEVRLEAAETESPYGPQATTVRRIGKHHLPAAGAVS